jgi:hypothetical protein
MRIGSTIPTAFSLLVANSLGGGQFGAAGGDTDFSLDAAAGDAVLRAEKGHSLFLQSGPYRSAICLFKNSTNVGIGSSVPRANLDVLGTPFMNGSSPVLSISGSTPSGIGEVPQGPSYLLNAAGQDVSNIALPASQSFSYQAQSINLQTGSVGYTHQGVAYTSRGARMTINGGKTLTTGSASEPNRHATIDFFTSGDANPVVRHRPAGDVQHVAVVHLHGLQHDLPLDRLAVGHWLCDLCDGQHHGRQRRQLHGPLRTGA